VSDTFVYVIATKHPDGRLIPPVKIGITSKVGARFRALNTASSRPLALLRTFGGMARDTAREIERELHETFSEERQHGEWFDIEPYVAELYVSGAFRRRGGSHPDFCGFASTWMKRPDHPRREWPRPRA
jgi:hypothetical protein